MQGAAERKTGAYTLACEGVSTVATQQAVAAVGCARGLSAKLERASIGAPNSILHYERLLPSKETRAIKSEAEVKMANLADNPKN